MFQFLKKFRSQKVNMLLFSFPFEKIPEDSVPKRKIVLNEKKNEYEIVENGILVHRSKIFKTSLLLKNFNFKQPFITIGDCVTHDDFRGLGIYPHVLRHIAFQHSGIKKVYILVSPDNIPSIKGIEKAGFKFVARLTCFKFLFFYLNKKMTSVRK